MVHCLPLWLTCILQLEGDDRSDEEEEDSDPPSDKRQSHLNGSGIRGRANGHWPALDTEGMSRFLGYFINGDEAA